MKITPLDIQQQKFKIRFRGFDIREVDEYLDKIADELGALEGKYERMEMENKRLARERQDYRKREETFKRALVSSQKVMEQMKDNAQKSAELIISNAEVKAEKTAAPAPVLSDDPTTRRLEKLDMLRKRNLISNKEYKRKKEEILKDL